MEPPQEIRRYYWRYKVRDFFECDSLEDAVLECLAEAWGDDAVPDEITVDGVSVWKAEHGTIGDGPYEQLIKFANEQGINLPMGHR